MIELKELLFKKYKLLNQGHWELVVPVKVQTTRYFRVILSRERFPSQVGELWFCSVSVVCMCTFLCPLPCSAHRGLIPTKHCPGFFSSCSLFNLAAKSHWQESEMLEVQRGGLNPWVSPLALHLADNSVCSVSSQHF